MDPWLFSFAKFPFITKQASVFCTVLLSLPSRGAWIEISSGSNFDWLEASLPSRGAWIEMELVENVQNAVDVAPLTGSVD